MGYLDNAGLQYLWGKLKEKFAPKSHNHDDRYYTESEMDGMLNSKVNNNEAGADGLLSKLTTSWTATPTDNTYFIRQDTGGGDSFGRVKFSTLWNYIKGKADGTYQPKGSYAASNHSHTKDQVGLGNVDNTADANKSVKYATSAGSASTADTATSATTSNGVKDYNDANRTIQIGFAGSGLTTSNLNYIAGYTDNGTKIKDVSKEVLTSWIGLENYLPLNGGTMNGQITRSGGGSWISDRNNVAVFGNSYGQAAGNSYNPVVGQKTSNGAWTIGNLAGNENLIFNYTTDSDYNAGLNNATAVYLPAQAGTIITSATIGSQSVNYANSAGSVAWGNVSGKPGSFTPTAHTHDDRYYTETEVNTKLDGKSNTGHTHDDRYYTESEINTKLASYQPKGSYAAASHTHNYAGSGSAGGSANSAVKLDSSAGSVTQPVYFKDGKPVATTYALNKTVPSDAIFTDTNTWRPVVNNLASDTTDQSLSAAQGKALKALIDGKANASHTHNYAGSGSAGGSANSAVKLDSSAGSATQPVYFSGGKPVAIGYTIASSVPADAKFTDTNTWRGIQNNLKSYSIDQSLSAAQGRILNEKISSLINKFNCTLTVYTSANSAITITLGSVFYSGTADSSGAYTFTITQLGTWTVKVTNNGYSSTDTIVINSYGTAYTINLYALSTTLNNNPWPSIKQQSDAGTASNYWKVGDTKTITINGTIAGASFSDMSINVFIAEFNHNISIEGSNRIHFLIGKSTSNASKLVGLTANYGSTSSGFRMNTSSTAAGGWSSSYMRKTILSQNTSNPDSNSLMAALPSDLRSVLKTVNKYSNNGTGSSPNISQSSDYLFLLSEYEVNGTAYACHNSEKSYQTQYDYFKAGNSKTCYRSDSESSIGTWWTRSPGVNTSSRFVYITSDGTSTDNANISHVLVVGFCV